MLAAVSEHKKAESTQIQLFGACSTKSDENLDEFSNE